MRDPFPWPPEGTPERLVRQHLDAEARTDAGDAVVDRAQARLAGEAKRPEATLPITQAWRWRAVLAASLVAAGLVLSLMFLAQPMAQASPAQLVAEAMQVSTTAIDRCYLLQVQRLGRDGEAIGRPLRESHLWTRGDRYRINLLHGRPGSVGQDENRRVWVAPTPAEGAYYDPDEMPEKLALASDLRTLRLDLLLHELTRQFDLRWDDPTTGSVPHTRRILATPRDRPVAGITRVALEVEPESKIVRRLAVERLRPALGKVRITLTWFSKQAQSDEFYHLESALKPGAPRHGRKQPLLRGRVLVETIRRFGPPLGG